MDSIIREYSPHIGVLEKGLKVGFYLAQAFCLMHMGCERAQMVRRVADARMFAWGLFAVRDLPRAKEFFGPEQLKEPREHFRLGLLLLFRGLFVARSSLKLINWVKPGVAGEIATWLGRPIPYFVLTFATMSLTDTMTKEKWDVKDGLSLGDDVAELICTSLEAGFLESMGPWCWVIAASGTISGSCALAKRGIAVWEHHHTSAEGE